MVLLSVGGAGRQVYVTSQARADALVASLITIITAIGETVNACARLESLTKEYDCRVIVSRRAADMAGLNVKSRKLHRVSATGQAPPVEFYALNTLADLQV